MRRTNVAFTLATAVFLVVASCRDPTEVMVEARTNVPYKSGIVTAFTVGSVGETENAFSTTETRDPWGPDGVVGSLVVVPGSAKDAPLSVKIVMGVTRDPHECSVARPDGCIFARRTLHYVPHAALHLPMALHAQCVGVPCDESSTCNYLGQCVSAAASCDGDACNVVGDSADGGVVIAPPPAADAATPDADAATDAPSDAKFDAEGGNSLDGSVPGDVQCAPGSYCSAPQICCWNPVMPAYACTDSASCIYAKMTCDDRADCGGDFCCVASGGSFCIANNCPGSYLCNGDQDCPAGTHCTGMFSNPWRACQ